MKRYRTAAVLMFIHGAFMEVGGCLCLLPALLFKGDSPDMSQYFTFIVPYLQDNLYLVSVTGLIYGVVRITGAVGLWKNRMWGLVLSSVNCVITMALMIFMLPAGIMDGILASSAFLLILTQYFGDRNIMD